MGATAKSSTAGPACALTTSQDSDRDRGEMCEQENESKEGKRREKRRKRVKGRKRVITSRVWERNLE